MFALGGTYYSALLSIYRAEVNVFPQVIAHFFRDQRPPQVSVSAINAAGTSPSTIVQFRTGPLPPGEPGHAATSMELMDGTEAPALVTAGRGRRGNRGDSEKSRLS